MWTRYVFLQQLSACPRFLVWQLFVSQSSQKYSRGRWKFLDSEPKIFWPFSRFLNWTRQLLTTTVVMYSRGAKVWVGSGSGSTFLGQVRLRDQHFGVLGFYSQNLRLELVWVLLFWGRVGNTHNVGVVPLRFWSFGFPTTSLNNRAYKNSQVGDLWWTLLKGVNSID